MSMISCHPETAVTKTTPRPASDPLPSVYGDCPWLVPADVPEVVDFIRHAGTPISFRKGDSTLFGSAPHVYLIEEGLVVTQPGSAAGFSRIVGIFGPGSVLGIVRAVGHGMRGMSLQATALTAVRAIRLDIPAFLRFLKADPMLHIKVLENCLSKTECQIDGVIVNDLISLSTRVLVALEVLLRAHPASERKDEAAPITLLPGITVSEIALLVHASREMTSRAIGEAVASGIVLKEGRRLSVWRPKLLNTLSERFGTKPRP